jgi:recombination protein RecR
MNLQIFPSKLLEKAVNQFASLPGIGRKTALRLVLHILKQSPQDVEKFAHSILELKKNVKHCKHCHNISDTDVCEICADKSRNTKTVCVVENIKDVMSIENTQQYYGVYHVLGGLISPMDGISPSSLSINSLEEKVKNGEIDEIIFALSATMEGDTTNFYIYKRLKNYPLTINTIARGVSIGDELEYIDEITLGRSIVNRMPFEGQL